MEKESYTRLKTRLIGALHNALLKDPDVTKKMLELAFRESCQHLANKGRLTG